MLELQESLVEFHKGKLVYGILEGKKVIIMQGRFHIYEGYSLQDVTYPVRIMKQLGISTLLVSNASGALNLNFKKGDLMLIEDHINFQGGSPLAFKGVELLGERFTDMSAPYNQKINTLFENIAKTHHIKLVNRKKAALPVGLRQLVKVNPDRQAAARQKMAWLAMPGMVNIRYQQVTSRHQPVLCNCGGCAL